MLVRFGFMWTMIRVRAPSVSMRSDVSIDMFTILPDDEPLIFAMPTSYGVCVSITSTPNLVVVEEAIQ